MKSYEPNQDEDTIRSIRSEREHQVWSSLEFRFTIQITVSPFPNTKCDAINEPFVWLKACECACCMMKCFVPASPFLVEHLRTSPVEYFTYGSPDTRSTIRKIKYDNRSMKRHRKQTRSQTEGREFLPCPCSGAQPRRHPTGVTPCPVPVEHHLPTALIPLSGYCASALP